MNNIYIMTIVKGVIGFTLALFLSKMIGTKIISKMNFIDLVMGVTMGSMIANTVIDKESPIQSEVVALILFSLLTILTSYISLKSIKARKLISSEPVILIKAGVIMNNNMKKVRMTTNELMMKLREKSFFDLTEVEYAIMESDGQVSVLAKAEKKAVTAYDMQLKVRSGGLVKDLIIDGKLIDENLKVAKIDIGWLEDNLRVNNISSTSELFYAGVDENKKLIISRKV